MIRTANLTHSVSRNAGGLFDGVRRLLQSISQTGVDAQVFATRDEFTEADLPAWAPTKVLAFPPTGPRSFGYSPQFSQALDAYQPHLSHTHGIWVFPSIATRRYCQKTNTPYLISPHGMLDGWAVRNSRWKKTAAHFLYEGAHLRGARCLRALCEAEADAFRKLGLRNEIAIIPNGVDLPAGRPPSEPAWHGLASPGQKVLLFLGRIHPKKGLVNLVRAWGASEDARSGSWALAIAGWDQGNHEEELKKLAADLGIRWRDARGNRQAGISESGKPPAIIFLGPQFGESKAACFHHCDGFILPSFSEGVPMAVLEAWVSSKSVLMTPQCNLAEGFAAGAALRVEPTMDSLAAGLAEFWRLTDSQRAEIGRKGYELATARFVWCRIAEQMKTLYEWMLGGGPRPSFMVDF